MKKLISVLLTLAIVLGLCACGGDGSKEQPKGLQVGFGRESIMPEGQVHLGGTDTAGRVSTGFMNYLYITCVALSEGGETVLVYTMDVITAADVFSAPAKEAISEATGVPQENILLNATHTHSGVGLGSTWTGVDDYRELFYEAAANAGKAAIADQSAAEVYYGSTETEGMAFIRHYEMSDGTYAGPNFGDFNSGAKIVGHTTEADVELQIVRFARSAKDKKDVVMMNFPAHATFHGGATDMILSADFPGPTRDYIEANSDTLVAYFIAAAGDQVPTSRIAGETYSNDYAEYGQRLGQYVVDAMPGLTKLESTGLKLSSKTFTGNTNKEKVDQVTSARIVVEASNTYGTASAQAKAVARENGFSSTYEAKAVIKRSTAPDTEDMVLRVMSIGDMGFIYAPYEMFSTQAMYIKDNSPYPMTFVVTCSEGDEGYLPSVKGFEIGSYESCVTVFARGTAETLADEFVSMLKEMKG